MVADPRPLPSGAVKAVVCSDLPEDRTVSSLRSTIPLKPLVVVVNSAISSSSPFGLAPLRLNPYPSGGAARAVLLCGYAAPDVIPRLSISSN